MSKTEMIRAGIEPSVKQDAEEILKNLGLSVTEAISLFYRQVVMHRGLPFLVKLPNELSPTTNVAQEVAKLKEAYEHLRASGTMTALELSHAWR